MKSKGILFLVLLFVLSLVGCTVQSKDNAPDTTVTVDSTSSNLVSEPSTSSTEYQAEVRKIVRWLENNADTADKWRSYPGSCRVTWYEDTKIEIRNLLYTLPETKCPSWVSMVKLYALPGHVGHFRVWVCSDINELSGEFQFILEKQYSATLFIKDFDIMSFFNLELENIPETERPTIQITSGSNGYTEAEITFK